MRSVSAFLAGVVAVVVAIVTVPLFWVSTHVADEDGYVAFSSVLATDGELQGAVAAYLADDYVQRGLLPAALQETATAVLTRVAQDTSNQPGFVAAWEQTQRSLHRSAFSDETGPLTVQLQPLSQFVADRVGARLPVSLDVPAGLTAPVGTSADRDRLQVVSKSQTYSLLGLMIVLAASAVCLVAARRRSLAIAGLGLGALVVAGVLRVVTEMVTPDLVDRTDKLSPFAGSVQKLIFDRAADSLSGWLQWIALIGAGAVLVGLLGRIVSGLRST